MKIAVVIPTLGRSFFALNMVMLLRAGSRQPDDIVIVDQTEPALRNPCALAQLRGYEQAGYCRLIEQQVKSATVARNRGAMESDADILVYVDDDAFVPPDFLAHYESLFQDPDLDAATGMILVNEADHGSTDASRTEPSRHDADTMLRGGNFAIRKHVLCRLGGLDENMVAAANHEDADLARRLHEAGCRVLWAAGPWLFHLSYQAGGGRTANSASHRNFVRNLCYYHRRRGHLGWRELALVWRQRVFNRHNMLRPWRIPARMVDFVRGYQAAARAHARGPSLPLKQ